MVCFELALANGYLVSPTSTGLPLCLQVGLLAILHGIILARDEVMRILKLNLTLKSALDLDRNGSPPYHPYAPLINYIRHPTSGLKFVAHLNLGHGHYRRESVEVVCKDRHCCAISKKVANMMFTRYQLLKLQSNSIVHQRVIKKPHCCFHLNSHNAVCSSFIQRMKYKTIWRIQFKDHSSKRKKKVNWFGKLPLERRILCLNVYKQ